MQQLPLPLPLPAAGHDYQGVWGLPARALKLLSSNSYSIHSPPQVMATCIKVYGVRLHAFDPRRMNSHCYKPCGCSFKDVDVHTKVAIGVDGGGAGGEVGERGKEEGKGVSIGAGGGGSQVLMSLSDLSLSEVGIRNGEVWRCRFLTRVAALGAMAPFPPFFLPSPLPLSLPRALCTSTVLCTVLCSFAGRLFEHLAMCFLFCAVGARGRGKGVSCCAEQGAPGG